MFQTHSIVVAILLLIGGIQLTQAQEQEAPSTISLKKGEVLDILLLQQRPEAKEALQSYFQVAFPVAKRMTYTPLPGFKVLSNENGNLLTENLILAKWYNLETREAFMQEVLIPVPDFHERRRAIWSYFGMTYYELSEDISFQIDRNKVHVASAYWIKEGTNQKRMQKEVSKLIEGTGGKALLMLRDGKSPMRYRYDPTIFVLSEWESAEAFEAFQKAVSPLLDGNLLHINEFSLQ